MSCDQMRLCLNNKNGTHGEFRCNWQRSAVGWWRILLQRPLALQQVSGEEREGPYGPALPATHQPFVQLQMWGEGQEMKSERETGAWIPLSSTIYFQPDTSPNLQPTNMSFTGASLKPSKRLEHESPSLIACQQLQCRNPTKCCFIVTKLCTD